MLVSWFSESSVASSGDEYRPDAVIKRVKKAGHANLVIKRALKNCGLVQQERILDKARERRRAETNPVISFTQEETEFIEVEEVERSYSEYGKNSTGQYRSI